jgi:hypothetical protein
MISVLERQHIQQKHVAKKLVLVTVESAASSEGHSAQQLQAAHGVADKRLGLLHCVDGLALSDLHLLLNQPPRKLGGILLFIFLG